jgi:hypothetical protein
MRQALWSCAVAAAFIFILGVTFYGINAQREPQIAAAPPAVTAPPALAGQGASTTGQGGSGSNTAQEK